jgi:membrane-bound lytic murein transglycosylase D
LTGTGCSQQSTNHLVINESPEQVGSADEPTDEIAVVPTPEVIAETAPEAEITIAKPADDSAIESNDVALAAAIKAIREAHSKTQAAADAKSVAAAQSANEVKMANAAVLAKAAAKKMVAKITAENIAADAAAKSVDEASAETYETAKTNNLNKHKVHLNSNSLWSRLFSLYALPDVDNPRIEQEIQKLLKHPNHLLAIQKRAEPYLYLILQEIESKNLPGELALLPIIESAFRVEARSPMDAVGLWQFMPATGSSFGLKQNWWYDGRRDVYASTEAATSYLKQLNKMLDGNWLLTLASYNWGIGNVQKAIRRNAEHSLDTNYWSLNMPRETMEYVPKLLAVAKLFAHADEYNFPLKNIPNQPFLKAINIDSQLDLSKAAEMAGMSWEEFSTLNPGFKHSISSPDGNYRLLVKIKYAATFKRKLAKLALNERVKWIEHTIQLGEDLNSIAKQHDISVRSLVEINQLNNKPLVIGSILHIPPNPESFRANT